MIDPHKICFVSCVNDENLYEECLLYLKQLQLPPTYQVEFLAVRGAVSATSGYNYAMKHSNAKYKVYMHQDLLLRNADLLDEMVVYFQRRPEVGVLGMVGCKILPASGIWWEAETLYGEIAQCHLPEKIIRTAYGEIPPEVDDIAAVDGVFMATQYDIPWNESVFAGWHFYDISQCMEFHKAGYKVMILPTNTAVGVHVCHKNRLGDAYEYWRNRFLQVYSIGGKCYE